MRCVFCKSNEASVYFVVWYVCRDCYNEQIKLKIQEQKLKEVGK